MSGRKGLAIQRDPDAYTDGEIMREVRVLMRQNARQQSHVRTMAYLRLLAVIDARRIATTGSALSSA